MIISCSKTLGAVSRMLCTVLKSKGQASSWKQRMTLAVGRPLAGCCCRHLHRARELESPQGGDCAEKSAQAPHSSTLAGPLQPHHCYDSVALLGFHQVASHTEVPTHYNSAF